MRELKFRAWDIDNNQFVYAHIGQDDVWLDDGISTIVMPLHHSEWELPTGLKDKNGKEIYEGDIIAQELIDDPFAGEYPTYIVCWDEEFLSWTLKDTTGDDGNDTDLHFFIAERRKCEVIGNIHENPELLEQEDAKN